MTDESEGPVHYQISITGRQAAAFFIALLVALGLAFFFGMKTGAAARKAPDAVTRLASASDIPVPTVPPETAPAPAEARPAAAPTAAAPEAVERKLGFEDAPPADTPTPLPKKDAEKKAERKPAAAPAKKEPEAKPERSEPPRAAEPAEHARAAEHAKAAKKEKDGPFVVQVAALAAEKADELAARLKKAGFRTDVSPAPGKPGTFRVRVGPYADHAKAEAVARRLVAEKWAKNPPVVKP